MFYACTSSTPAHENAHTDEVITQTPCRHGRTLFRGYELIQYTKGPLKGSEVVFGLYLTALFDRIVTSIPRTYR
jgi:hypothetical protein